MLAVSHGRLLTLDPAGFVAGIISRPVAAAKHPRSHHFQGADPMEPKTLSEAVLKGFAYLINQQHGNGGWSQGGGWRTMSDGGRMEGPDVADPPDVANTCV